MKVIIAVLSSKYVHASLAPWCLLAGARAFCNKKAEFCVMESTINRDIPSFADEIEKERPDIVSLSTYIWNIQKTLELCEVLKERLGCTIVLGGPEVAYRPADILQKYRFIDYVLSGEGEWAFAKFVDLFDSAPQSVDGLTYRDGERILSVPEKEYTDTPPSPYSDEYFDSIGGRICYIESSRGCPYRCAFCLSGRCSGLRFFDIEQIKKDMIRLANCGTQTVKFVDRTFNANATRANEIFLFIKENYGKAIPQGISFHFEIAGDILKESTFDILRDMPKGAVQLEIGMQTFNEDTLKAINRKTDTEKLINNIKRLISFGNMHIHIDLIAGLTGEDIESFKRSFNIAYSLKAHMLQMGFLKLLYGADMREQPDRYPCEFSSEPPYEVISTPWLSRDEVILLKKCEDALDRLWGSGRFLLTLEFLTEDIGLDPFDLFCGFGNAVNGANMSLTEYCKRVYKYFAPKCDSEVLREKLICDLLCSSQAVQIPDVLKRQDPLYKKIKAKFKDGNIKIAILYKSGEVFAVDQAGEKDLFGRFCGKYYELKMK